MVSSAIKFLLIGAATLLAQFVRADAIVLRSSVRVASDAPVTLKDIASLEGSDAQSLGEAVIIADPVARRSATGTFDLSIDDVRQAVSTAKPEARWGKIALSGDTCTLRVAEPKPLVIDIAPAPAPTPPAPGKLKPIGPDWRLVSELKEDTVRSGVASRLASFLKAEPADVRVAFSDADAKLLDTPGTGRILDIQPTGLGALVPVMVRVFEGEKVIAAGTAKVQVEQKLNVVAASRALHRGDVVSRDVIIAECRWTAPGERLIPESSVVGFVVKNRMQVGQLFVEGDVEPALLVKRGDIVNVACLAGSVVMNTRARALSAAREGETIDFAPLRNPKSKVSARVVAAGQAVINAAQPEDQVFANEPAPQPALQHPPQPAPADVPQSSKPQPSSTATTKATVGAISVEKVTTRPDGTFVVDARTQDPKKPLKKMKFTPLDVP